jgi:hydroxyacylglutathione hydrolase
MRVIPIPCLSDNYAYLVEGSSPGECVIIDPSEYAPVQAALGAAGLKPAAVLCTHHHFDHVGGVVELAKAYPGLEIIGSAFDRDRIEGLTRTVVDREKLTVGGVPLEVRSIPGHTMGAVVFAILDNGEPSDVFTGDTLFVAGCGRLFEGTPTDMYGSLIETLNTLPPHVRVYCGHEYTESNLRFAAHVEPRNAAVTEKALRVAEARKQGLFTVPSTIAEEQATNPFMRVAHRDVIAFAEANGASGTSGPEVLGAIRAAKDTFKLAGRAMLTVADIMSRSPLRLSRGMPLADAVSALSDRGFDIGPVCDGEGRALGVFAKADVADRLCDGPLPETVGEVMSTEVFSTSPAAPVLECISKMVFEGVWLLLVLDADGELCGVVTGADVLRAIADGRLGLGTATAPDSVREPRELGQRTGPGVPSLPPRS